MIVYLQNQSTLVTDADVYNMSMIVCRQLLTDFCPAWGLQPSFCRFLKRNLSAPAGSVVIGVLDNADQAGDLGWHTEANDVVYGRVFAEPVLQNGGNILSDQLSVCSVVSHEVLETVGDPFCNSWSDGGQGSLYAFEMCDAVESDSYIIALGTTSSGSVAGTVSDFITPAWFNPDATAGKFDFMALLTRPFGVRDTGYVSTMTDGTVAQSFGEHYPDWRKTTKATETARTARRNAESHRTAEGELKLLGHHLRERF